MRKFFKLLCLLALFTAISCNFTKSSTSVSIHDETSNSESSIVPPFQEISVPTSVWEFDPIQGGVFITEKGSKLIIPANAFVDENGNPVTEKVKILFQEIHSAAEQIISGIPMTYNNNGIVENFESAGMFEINGTTISGKKINISQNVSLDLQLATTNTDNNFNYYSFNKQTNQWEEIGVAPKSVNISSKNSSRNNISLDNNDDFIIPKLYNQGEKVYNFAIDNLEKYHLANYQGVMWSYSGNDDTQDPEKNKWIFEEKWTKINLVKIDKSEFRLLFSKMGYVVRDKKEVYEEVKSFETRVQPVMSAKLKDKFDAERKKEIENRVNNYNKGEKNKAAANFVRNIAIKGFGLFNCDRYYGNEDAISLMTDFSYEKNNSKRADHIYLIFNNKGMLTVNDNAKMSFNSSENNAFVAIMPDQSVYFLNAEDFKKQVKNLDDAILELDLKKYDGVISNVSDFDNLIKSL